MIKCPSPPAPTPRKRGGRKPAASKQKGSKAFAFVESDPTGRAPAEHRRFIRSHVMRGKNTAKRVPRLELGSGGPTWINGDPGPTQEPTPPAAEDHSRGSSPGSPSHVTIENPENGPRTLTFHLPCLPGPIRPPPDLALCQLSEEVDDTSRYFIRRFFTSIKETMYPLEWCSKFDPAKVCWFYWMYHDSAYLHSLLFTVSAFQDLVACGGVDVSKGGNLSSVFSKRTQVHLRRTFELLQEKLQDPEKQLEDVTAATVISLAMMADAIGDTAACEMHVSGLKEMVRLRGGIKALSHNRQLQIKICRVDLGWSVKNGSRPMFFFGDISWARFFDKILLRKAPLDLSADGSPIEILIHDQDIKLQNVFADMRDFTRMANVFINSKDKFQPELFQEIMLSIQYRLLLLEYSFDTQPLSEAIRVGLLAFQATIFLQVPGLKLKFDHLAGRLRLAIDALDASTPVLADLKLWLLLIGSIALVGSDELWLMSEVTDLTVEDDWTHIRERMKSIMWVDVVHDTPGKAVFEATKVVRDLGQKHPWAMGI